MKEQQNHYCTYCGNMTFNKDGSKCGCQYEKSDPKGNK